MRSSRPVRCGDVAACSNGGDVEQVRSGRQRGARDRYASISPSIFLTLDELDATDGHLRRIASLSDVPGCIPCLSAPAKGHRGRLHMHRTNNLQRGLPAVRAAGRCQQLPLPECGRLLGRAVTCAGLSPLVEQLESCPVSVGEPGRFGTFSEAAALRVDDLGHPVVIASSAPTGTQTRGERVRDDAPVALTQLGTITKTAGSDRDQSSSFLITKTSGGRDSDADAVAGFRPGSESGA